MTLSDLSDFAKIQRQEASRGLSATAVLLVCFVTFHDKMCYTLQIKLAVLCKTLLITVRLAEAI